ncbi:hypothetical protein [Microbulbifer sp. SSSA002]|uniref:hypothetical protein n=1 Tax=Microbulbifer sp. SSSA002 TaxID=3243376 RepID=UPI0040397CE6
MVHYVAEASNTLLNVYAKNLPGELGCENDFDSEIVYEYRSDSDCDVLDRVCWLGAHFTWAMYKAGIINSQMEQDFCAVFDEVSRST